MNKHFKRIMTASMASALAVSNLAIVNASANEEIIEDSTASVTEDSELIVNGFTVTPIDDAKGYSIETIDVINGYNFKVNIEEGYEANPDAKVKVLKGPTSYTINLADIKNENGEYVTSIVIDKETRLEVEGIIPVESIVTIAETEEETGFTITPISETNTASPEKGYKFKVISDGTHTNLNLSSSNGNIVQGINNTYTLTNVTSDAEITIASDEAEGATYDVVFPTGGGYAISTLDATTGIEEGGSISFSVVPEEGYDLYEIVVCANGIIIPNQHEGASNNLYTIENITSNTEVTITNVKLRNESEVIIDTTGMIERGILFTEITSDKLDTYKFTLSETEEGALDKYVVVLETENGVQGAQKTADGVYYFNKNVGGTIAVTLVEKTSTEDTTPDEPTEEASLVTWPTESSQYELVYEQRDENTYYFKVNAKEGYDVSNIKVTANGEELTPDAGGAYRISTIDGSVTIAITGVTKEVTDEKTAYSIAWSAGEGTSFNTTSNSVNAGEDLKFTVNVKEGYEEADLIVFANGAALEPNTKGEYTIIVNEDTKIETSSLSKKVFEITTTTDEGAKIKAPKTVVYGNSYGFTVTVDNKYDMSTAVVTVNGETVAPTKTEGQVLTYTVKEAKDLQDINVSGLMEKAEHTITYGSAIGATITYSKETVMSGDSYTFTIAISEGYDGSNMIVKVNGKEVTANNGQYTVTDVKEDQIVSISGVKLVTHCVQTQVLSGIVLTTNSPYDVKPGDDFTFSISFNSTIDPTTISVTANGKTLTGSNWTYTVKDVTEDVNIKITANNIELNDSNSTIKKGTGSQGATGSTGNSTTQNDKGNFTDVKTGDNKHLYPILGAVMGASLLATVVAIFMPKKNKLKR